MCYVHNNTKISTNIKTWFRDLGVVQGVLDGFNGAKITNYSTAIKGLSLNQAQLLLSTEGLNKAKQKEILIDAGLIASENKIQGELLQSILEQKGLNAAKQQEVLIELGLMDRKTKKLLIDKACTRETLEAVLAQKLKNAEDAEGIIKALGLAGANTTTTASFGLLTKSIWANIKAMGVWLVTTPTGVFTLIAGSLAVAALAVTKYNEKLEENRQKMIDAGKEASQLTEDLDGIVEEYRKLGEDGAFDNSDREQAKNIQQQINDLLGDEIGYVNLANGKYEDQLKLLQKLQYQKAKDNYKTIKDAKTAAEDSLLAVTPKVTSGFNNAASESKAIKQVLKEYGFDKYIGTSENDNSASQIIHFAIDNSSAESTIQSLEDMKELRDVLRQSYEDEISAGGDLEDFYNNLDKKIGELSERVTKYKEALNDYNVNEAVIQFNENEFSGVKGALIDTKEEMESWANAILNSTDLSADLKKEIIAIAGTNLPQFKDTLYATTRQFYGLNDAGTDVNSKLTVSKSRLDDMITNLSNTASECGLTTSAMAQMILKLINLNNTKLNLSQQIAEIMKLRGAMGLETSKLTSQEIYDYGVKYKIGTTGKGGYSYKGKWYNSYNDMYYAVLNDMTNEEISDFTGGDGNPPPYTPPGDKDKDKDKPDYENPTDAIINRINLRSKELEQQEEYIQNQIEIAELENDYKKQISLTNDKLDIQRQKVEALKTANDELHQMAEDLRNSTPDWNEEEWFDSQGNATEAYNTLYNNSSKEDQEKIKDQFEKISKIKEAWTGNADEIVAINKEILQSEEDIWDIRRQIFDDRLEESEDYIEHSNNFGWENGDNEVAARKRVLEWIQSDYYKSLIENDEEYHKILEENRLKYIEAQKEAMEKTIADIEDYIDARNTYNDWGAYGDSEVKAIQRITKEIEKAYKERLLSQEEYIDKLEEQTKRIYQLGQDRVDKHLSDIDKYIDARNFYNDWDDFGDSEINAIEKQLKVLKNAYRLNLISYEDYTERFAEYTQKLYSVAKDDIIEEVSKLVEEYEEIKQLESSQLESQKTLLQSYYDVTNALTEAQHEINKELKASQSMYEYLNEETRELLFNQEDYNALNKELLDIQSAADELQKQYQEDILNANAETIDEITSQYQMQYETMMKQYEIAKAELEVAKKRQKLDNVLAERNTRMFINGQWQWVAKTQNVIDAQNELAEAEINRKKQEASLEQTNAINEFTEHINSLKTDLNKVRKYWENMQEMLNGESDEVAKALKEISNVSSPELKKVIVATGGSISSFSTSLSESINTLSTVINSDLGNMSTDISDIVTDLESYSDAIKALVDKINNININVNKNDDNNSETDSSSSSKNSSSSGGGSSSSKQVNTTDQWVNSNGIIQLNPNWDGKKKGGVGSFYKHADGTRYTPGGQTIMGEEGFEAFIDNNGRLIPINQPTIGNIGAGGIVFNREQMANLRNLWDWSNISKISPFVSSSNANNQNTVVDNSIHINGLTVGEQGNEDWINGLRRYVATHK